MNHINTSETMAPDATLMLTPSCPHCPAVLQALGQLVKEGAIGRLEVVNIVVHPERAEALGVRGVPWIQIGEFELEGSHTPAELRSWVERATRPDGVAVYLSELLEAGQLSQALAALQHHPHWMDTVIELVASGESGISVRLGIGAMLDDLAGTAYLTEHLDALARLLESENHGVRSDAVHYLGLSHSPAALPYLKQALQDPHEEVREIAQETLDELAELGIT